MNILSVAFPLLPVSADSAGGAEQILWLLERGLVDEGCGSIVVAAEGSSISGRLVPTPAADGEITEAVRGQAYSAHRNAIQSVLASNSIDLIHFHGLDFAEYIPPDGPAMLATLHLPVSFYPKHIFDLPEVMLNAVSRSQAASFPAEARCPVICNGIDVARYGMPAKKEDFLFVLARICPEKGIDMALRVAHRLGLELIVAGPVHPFAAHQAYFNDCVKPLLDEKRQYIGPIGRREKIDLLARAKCLLAPSLVAETSSLVAMEALASGTPVIAYRSGALPEIVEDGVTGFLVDSEEEMARAVEKAGVISPEDCRAAAAVRFDANRMVHEYLNVYRTATVRKRSG